MLTTAQNTITARQRLLAGLPAAERRLALAGISTPVLEGGAGEPLVLLHGPGANATHWASVVAPLTGSHRVIAPDLPGHGGCEVADGPLDAGRVLEWLDELIEQTCPSPPVLAGHALGGAIAARFAGERGDRVRGIVLVDTLGLVPFAPAPGFGMALNDFLAQPRTAPTTCSGANARSTSTDCARGWASAGSRFGPTTWRTRARPSNMAALGALMEQFGAPAIEPALLERIAAPTSLIWGRHDLATPLAAAEAASARYGWPLHVIEDCADDPPVEQPEAFAEALGAAVGQAQRSA